MSINIFDEHALSKMAEIEGLPWKNREEENPDPNCSFKAFFDFWVEQFSHREDLQKEGADLGCFISINGNGAIYGESGFNRYAVRYDGKLFFLRDCSIKEQIAKAEALGFDIM